MKYLRFTIIVNMILTSCIYDESTCESIEVLYSADIAPMIDTKCATCHAGPSPELDLTDYEQVSDSLTSIKILELVQLDLGDTDVMPPAPNALLSDCQILLFQTWIQQGRQNN